MLTERPQFINEAFYADSVTSADYDLLLSDGWRHFGSYFFRYSLNYYRDEIVRVVPLRIRLSKFQLSKSQRSVLRRNEDLAVEFAPIAITAEIEELFDRHKRRFDHAVPESVYDFLGEDAANYPTRGLQITARDSAGRLLAISFFDAGETSVSAIYGCFEPDEGRRSLGILTMLKVIAWAEENGKTFYYHGYSYDTPSFYDYKLRFSGLEQSDWNGHWIQKTYEK